jgi:hypothetical protein
VRGDSRSTLSTWKGESNRDHAYFRFDGHEHHARVEVGRQWDLCTETFQQPLGAS